MSPESKRELVEKLRPRYLKASKKQKGAIRRRSWSEAEGRRCRGESTRRATATFSAFFDGLALEELDKLAGPCYTLFELNREKTVTRNSRSRSEAQRVGVR